jgi:hypothetical protein
MKPNFADSHFALSVASRGLHWAAAALTLVFAFAGLEAVAMAADVSAGAPAVVNQPLTPAANDTPDEQPTPQHMWIAGHWRWHDNAYVWEAGHWELPPTPNVSWVAPQWEQRGSGYVLRDGYWQENPPQAVPTPQVTSTTVAPPPPKPESIPERPSAAHVWTPGYWDWQNGQHVWVAGQWQIPPRPNMTWVPAHWEARENRFVLVAGYWRDNTTPMPPPQQPVQQQIQIVQPAQPQSIVVVTPPPAPRTEVMYYRPSPYHVWIPGYWAWRAGRHVWIAGHWELPPQGHRHWEEPRWERRGGNYIFLDGHWR